MENGSISPPLLLKHFEEAGVEFPGRCISCGNTINSRIPKMMQLIEEFPFAKLIDVYIKFPEMRSHINLLKKIYCHVSSYDDDGNYSPETENENNLLFDKMMTGTRSDYQLNDDTTLQDLLDDKAILYSELEKFFAISRSPFASKLKGTLIVDKPGSNLIITHFEQLILDTFNEKENLIAAPSTGGKINFNPNIAFLPVAFSFMGVGSAQGKTFPLKEFRAGLNSGFQIKEINELLIQLYPFEERRFSLPYRTFISRIIKIPSNILNDPGKFSQYMHENFDHTLRYFGLSSASSYEVLKRSILLADNNRILFGLGLSSSPQIGNLAEGNKLTYEELKDLGRRDLEFALTGNATFMDKVNRELGYSQRGQTFISKTEYDRIFSYQAYSEVEQRVFFSKIDEVNLDVSIYEIYMVLYKLGQFDYSIFNFPGLISKYNVYQVVETKMKIYYQTENMPRSAFTHSGKQWRMSKNELKDSMASESYEVLLELYVIEVEILKWISEALSRATNSETISGASANSETISGASANSETISGASANSEALPEAISRASANSAKLQALLDIRWLPLHQKLNKLDELYSFSSNVLEWNRRFKGLVNLAVPFSPEHTFALELPGEMMEQLKKKRHLSEELKHVPNEQNMLPFGFYPISYYNYISENELDKPIRAVNNGEWSKELKEKIHRIRSEKIHDFSFKLNSSQKELLELAIYPPEYEDAEIPLDELLKTAAQLGMEEVSVLGPFLEIIISMVGLRISCCRGAIINPYRVPEELYSGMFSNIRDVDPNALEIIHTPNKDLMILLQEKAERAKNSLKMN